METEAAQLPSGNLLLTAVLVAAALLALKFLPRLMAGVPFVPPKTVKDRLDRGDDIVIVDVRTEGEFTGTTGHVPGSINLPLGDVALRLATHKDEFAPLKSEPIYLLCRTENRSPRAARLLRKAGFTNVSIIGGGIMAWTRAGFPLEGRRG